MTAQILAAVIFVGMFALIIMDKFERQYVTLGSAALVLVVVFGIWRPTLFRCPYGEYNDTVVSTINGLGMHVIQWDVDSLDWKGLSSDEITSRVLTRVQPGSIVLFHNAAEHTPEALAGIIEALIADGYSIIPISQMILPGDTSIDPNGRQRPAAADEGA